jgi:hypothetical protein
LRSQFSPAAGVIGGDLKLALERYRERESGKAVLAALDEIRPDFTMRINSKSMLPFRSLCYFHNTKFHGSSIQPSIHQTVFLIHPFVNPSVRPSVHPSTCPPIHRSIHCSIHSSIHWHPSTHPSIYFRLQSIYLFFRFSQVAHSHMYV